jgi:4-oxalocrotonate tautomerase
MPHVIVKLWPGKSEQQKARLSEAIVKDAMNILNYGEGSVSLAIEEVKPHDWAGKVYRPDILNQRRSSTRNQATTRLNSVSSNERRGDEP